MNRVLVIDDDADFAYVFSLILGTVGYSCEIVNTAGQAVNILSMRCKDFSAVFLDVMLKETDGKKLGREIKNKYPNIKLVMLSAMSESVKAEILKKSGADYFLGKPVNKDNLIEVLSK